MIIENRAGTNGSVKQPLAVKSLFALMSAARSSDSEKQSWERKRSSTLLLGSAADILRDIYLIKFLTFRSAP